MRLAVLALPLLFAAPLMAQDLAGEYIAAARVFSLPGSPNDPEAQLRAAGDMVAALSGDWLPAWMLVDDMAGQGAMDMILTLATETGEWCAQTSFRASVLGPHSFELRTFRNGEDSGFAVRYQYVMGRSFQRSVDEVAHLTRLGLADRPETIPPQIYAGSGISGVVEVFVPSANVLVIQPQSGNAEIYLRCP